MTRREVITKAIAKLQEAGTVKREPARGKYRRRRERRPRVGMLVHVDASTHQCGGHLPTRNSPSPQ
jgi:hypothetical protein